MPRPSHRTMLLLFFALLFQSYPTLSDDTSAKRTEFQLPTRVKILPVFIVPKDQSPPNPQEKRNFIRHLQWSQERFRVMLSGRSTFEIASTEPVTYAADQTLTHYRGLGKGKVAPAWTAELLQHFGETRFTCPTVYVAVIMNRNDRFPIGGGRPINGGINTGGAILVISAYALNELPYFQSILQHELGHCFGLPHVDVYGRSMKTSMSIMSYNPAKRPSGFRPSRTPGILIPEDIRALALNDRVFDNLEFNLKSDIPQSYTIPRRIVPLAPMAIAGQNSFVPLVTTPSGGHNQSSVTNIVAGRVTPSEGPGVTFDPKTMWTSDVTKWATVNVIFPASVTLASVGIHSQHSGKYHRAESVRLEARVDNSYAVLTTRDLSSSDARVSFPATTATHWRFGFKTGKSGRVTIRGLRFYSTDGEIFPQLIP